MATHELQEQIKALRAQIDEYKRKFQDEVELKRQCEEELRKKEAECEEPITRARGMVIKGAATAPGAALSSSTSSASSSPASSTTSTPHDSSDAVVTRPPRPTSLPKDAKKEKKEKKHKKEKSTKKNKSATSETAKSTTFTVRSIEAHKATSKSELSFAKGITITVIDENKAEDLLKGQIGKKEGWFPSYYVVRT